MRTRARCLAMLASLAIAATACGARGSLAPVPSATPAGSPSGSGPPGSSPSASAPSASAPASASPEPLRIGLVTAVPSAEGAARDSLMARAVATAAGDLDAVHEVIETEEESDYPPNVQAFVEHGFGIVVTVGEAAGPATFAAAQGAPDTRFIGVDQVICVTPTGEQDPGGVCDGDAAILAPNYQAVRFADEQAAYLAGVVAASLSTTGRAAVVGGTGVPWVIRAWRGFENGAMSIAPRFDVPFVELAPDASGFGDPALGRAAADQLIVDGADFLFELAGPSGAGVIEGACAAGVHAIGSIVDQGSALPESGCVATSAERRYADVLSGAIVRASEVEMTAGIVTYGLGDDPPGVGLSPMSGVELSADAAAILDSAIRALASGTLDPCAPVACTSAGN